MRDLKKGDRCEARGLNPDTLKLLTCEIRHMEGTPPRSLMPCVKDRKTVFLCSDHSAMFPRVGERKKQRPRKAIAEQLDLMQLAIAGTSAIITESNTTRMGIPVARSAHADAFRLPMPED